MKRILLAAAATAFLVSSAFAADMPAKAPTVVPAFSWTGLYIGGTVGGIWASEQLSNEGPFGTIFGARNHLNGVLGGPTLGYNFQSGPLVWGVEGDFSWTSINHEVSFGNEKIPYFATARLRGGYASGNSFLYLTGGAAFTRFNLRQDGPGGVGEAERSVTGWTAGAGWEHAFARNWSWKVEYLFADFGHPQSKATAYVPVRHDLSEQVVRIGLNYRFGSN